MQVIHCLWTVRSCLIVGDLHNKMVSKLQWDSFETLSVKIIKIDQNQVLKSSFDTGLYK